MKKLIFRKFAKDTLIFFIIMCLSIGLIVWTLQAVNYFDFVTQDGHGLKTYFTYTILNFPKIIHRIIPFIFFITLFYLITNYEQKNELSIFWLNGISKIDFTNKIIFLSIILTIFQIFLGSLFSPYSQFKARESLKNSNIDFFTSLIKEGKFINAVEGLTIFIKEKNIDQSFSNIFIDDSTKNNSKMIYAKNGIIVDNYQRKSFQLFNGKVINNEKRKMIEASMNLLFQSMLKAEMDNDPSALSRLSKELRELLKLAPDLSNFPEPQWEDEQFSSFEESVS